MGTFAKNNVHARIDADTERRASEALRGMGLSVSDAIRLLLERVAEDGRLPFTIKIPSQTTREAIEELEQGKGRRVPSVAALLDDLDADN